MPNGLRLLLAATGVALACATTRAQTGLAELGAAFAFTDDPQSAFARRVDALAKLDAVDQPTVARDLLAAWLRVHGELRAVERERGVPAHNLVPSVSEMHERAALDAGLRLTGQIESLLVRASADARAPLIDALFDGHVPIQLRAALAPAARGLDCDPARAIDALATSRRPDDTWVALRALRALGRRHRRPRRRRRPTRHATEGGYFGIPQDGRSILYLVDASLPMRSGMGRNDARSRWDACVAELESAIGSLGPDQQFTIVVFAQRVRVWHDKPVRADATQVTAAKKWIEAIDLELGTAAFEGFEVATTIAGPSTFDRCFDPAIDTVFFLSDGRPTVRRADQPRSLEADDPALIERLLERRDPLHCLQISAVLLGRGGTAFMRRHAADHGGRFAAR